MGPSTLLMTAPEEEAGGGVVAGVSQLAAAAAGLAGVEGLVLHSVAPETGLEGVEELRAPPSEPPQLGSMVLWACK